MRSITKFALMLAVMGTVCTFNLNQAFAADSDGDGVDDADDKCDDTPKYIDGEYHVHAKGTSLAGCASFVVCLQDTTATVGKEPSICGKPSDWRDWSVTDKVATFSWTRVSSADLDVYDNLGDEGYLWGQTTRRTMTVGTAGVGWDSSKRGEGKVIVTPSLTRALGDDEYLYLYVGTRVYRYGKDGKGALVGTSPFSPAQWPVVSKELFKGSGRFGSSGVAKSTYKKDKKKADDERADLQQRLSTLQSTYQRDMSVVAGEIAAGKARDEAAAQERKALGDRLDDVEGKVKRHGERLDVAEDAIVDNARGIIDNRRNIRVGGLLVGIGGWFRGEKEISVEGDVYYDNASRKTILLHRDPWAASVAINAGGYRLLGEHLMLTALLELQVPRSDRGFGGGLTAFFGGGNRYGSTTYRRSDGSKYTLVSPVLFRIGLEGGVDYDSSGILGELSGFGPTLPGVRGRVAGAGYLFFRPSGEYRKSNLPCVFVRAFGGGRFGGIWPVANGRTVYNSDTGLPYKGIGHQEFVGGFTIGLAI